MGQFAVFPAMLIAALSFSQLKDCSGSDSSLALGATSRERVALTATAAKIVTDLPVAEGAFVTEGTVLVRLDDRIEKANLAVAQAELAGAKANLEKLRAGAREEEIAAARATVAGAKAQVANAKQTYERNSALVKNETVTEAKLDRNKADLDIAQAALDKAKDTLRELENGARPEDLAMAEADVQAATARVEAQQQTVEELTITASRNGRLDSLPWNLGERVTAGSPVAVLLADDPLLARVYVPEPHRVHISEGDKVEVRVDGIDTPFQGTVAWISSDPAFTPYYGLNRTDRARLMYLAEIELPPEAQDLPLGVPAQAVLP